jgi:bifunctional oligoribonuclease and PAP phosphatase NrnA
MDERVKSFEHMSDSLQLIESAKSITLLTHTKPDGDGVGACIALDYFLSSLGKKVETVYPDAPEFDYKRKPKNLFIGKHSQKPDLLIACDVATYDRMYYPSDFKNIPLINIDHHVSNAIHGTYNFVDPEASSASEVVYLLIKQWSRKLVSSKLVSEKFISPEIADALLFGILYDSRLFHTQATQARTLRIAADLIDLGANLFKIKIELFSHKDPKILKLWELVLQRIKISKNQVAAWSYLTQQDLKKFNLKLSSLVGFSDFLSDISDIDVSILFYETESGETKVSLRSKTYDVNKLAAQFGGGGHKNASGIMSKRPLQDLMPDVINVIEAVPR